MATITPNGADVAGKITVMDSRFILILIKHILKLSRVPLDQVPSSCNTAKFPARETGLAPLIALPLDRSSLLGATVPLRTALQLEDALGRIFAAMMEGIHSLRVAVLPAPLLRPIVDPTSIGLALKASLLLDPFALTVETLEDGWRHPSRLGELGSGLLSDTPCSRSPQLDIDGQQCAMNF
jgi:hypothetical protein